MFDYVFLCVNSIDIFTFALESPDFDAEQSLAECNSILVTEKVKYSRLILIKCILSEYIQEKHGSYYAQK